MPQNPRPPEPPCLPARRAKPADQSALIFILLVALLPIGTTVLISFKREEDVTRKPPVIFPCDTPRRRST